MLNAIISKLSSNNAKALTTVRPGRRYSKSIILLVMLLFPVISNAVTTSVNAPSTDSDGTFTVYWTVSVSNQGGYAYLQQRFNGGSWMVIADDGFGSHTKTVSVSTNGSYDFRTSYGYIPTGCGQSCGLITGNSAIDTTVVTINTQPTISGCGTLTINEDGQMGIPIYVSDAETAVGSLTLTASSNNQSLISDGNVNIVNEGGGIFGVGFNPLPDQNGTATVTLTVSDGSLSASCNNILTVTAVNDAPTISNISNKTINEDNNSGNIGFNVGDVETSAGSLTVTASSSNTTLVPNGNLTLGGSGGSRTILVTPAANQSGTSTITVTVSDGSLSDSDTFVVTVNAVNDTPTISNIGNQTINEDANTGDIGFTVSDAETAAGSLTVTAVSSNIALIPNGNLILGGSGSNRTVRAVPLLNQSGTSTITVTVSDGVNSTSDTFDVIVNAVNDAPVISTISDVSIDSSTTTGDIPFTVSDVDLDPVTVTAASSNTALVPVSNIVLGGSGSSRTVRVTPVSGQTGTAIITLTADDGTDTTDEVFNVVVANPPLQPFDFDTEAPSEFTYDLNDTSSIPSLGSGEFIAATQGSLSISDGAAQYRVPITLPPAVRDLKPNLALTYNSRGGNGQMGVGWNLSGLSKIYRCSPTYATEGTYAQDSNPRYTNSDRLCLDGQKLEIASSTIPASDSTYWASGAEYRTEIDTFDRITAVGTHTSFEVRTKDGLILNYGQQDIGQNSQIYAPTQPGGPISIWALDKVEDRYGNSYTIHYTRDTANGDYYPSHIVYAPGASVVFNYIDRSAYGSGNQSDYPWGYDAGNLHRHPKLLVTVSTFTGVTSPSTPSVGTKVRDVLIDYARSPTTDRLRVSSIRDCGYDEAGNNPQCTRPLNFGWQAGEFGFEDQAATLQSCSGANIDTTYVQIGDIDNDGYDDLLSFNAEDSGAAAVYFWYQAQTCYQQAAWATAGSSEWTNARLLTTPRGKALLVAEKDASMPTASVATIVELDPDNGYTTGSVTSQQPSSVLAGLPTFTIADWNNDGLDDFLYSNKAFIQQYSNPVSFNVINNGFFGYDPGDNGAPVEFDGDGLTDLFYNRFRTASGGYEHSDVEAFKYSGTNFGYSSLFQLPVSDTEPVADPYENIFEQGSQVYNLIDVNGDGKQDYVYHRIPTGQSEGVWYLHVNSGDGFWPQGDTGTSSFAQTNQFSYTYDWDKDGREDLITIRDANSCSTQSICWRVLLSRYNGSGYPAPHAFTEASVTYPFNGNLNAAAGAMSYDPKYQVLRGDFNHDGIMDLSYETSIWYGKQQQSDLLTSVTDGFGAQVQLQYSPLVSDDNNGEALYLPATVPVFPQQHAPRDMQVVNQVSVSNGLGGFNNRYYHYRGAKLDAQGRGFLGFEQIKVTNTPIGTVSTATYRQDYPYTGRIDSMEVKATDGNLIRRVDNDYAVHSQNARYPYLSESITQEYGLTTTDTNQPLSVTKTVNTMDQYGTLVNQTRTTGTGLSGTTVTGVQNVTTVNNYISNDVTNWLLGFVNWRTVTASQDGSTGLRSINADIGQVTGTLDIAARIDFYGEQNIQTYTQYTRNANGIVTQTQFSGADIDGNPATPRTVTSANFDDVIYPGTATNAEGHVTTFNAYDKRYGGLKTVTNPNGLVTTREYDALGRLVKITAPDGTVTRIVSYDCDSSSLPYLITCPSNAEYFSATEVTHPSAPGRFGAPITITYYDSLQRQVRREAYGFNGDTVKVDTEYLVTGRLSRVSEPYTGVSADYWTVYSNYDELGRVLDIVPADDGNVSLEYTQENGQLKTREQVTVLKPDLSIDTRVTTRYTNALGQVVRVEDAQNTPVDYTYDSQGNLATTMVDANAATTIAVTHDVAGNKTFISDPDVGDIRFEYNGFRELRRQTWAPGTGDAKSIEYQYDRLGRKTQRTDTDANSSVTNYTWTWDTTKQGLLNNRSGNGFTETYGYNGQSRLVTQTTTIAGLSGNNGERMFSYGYDEFGRPNTVTYPDSDSDPNNNFTVEHLYHAAGMPVQTVDTGSGDVLWALGNSSDDRGTLYQQLFGNGVVTESGFDLRSGRLTTVVSGRLSASNTLSNLTGDIQNLIYGYDSLGNLYNRSTGRTDGNGQVLESILEEFEYDNLNRLTSSETNGLSITGNRTRSYQYDDLGNLTYRSDTGTLTYSQSGNAGPHAVTAANGVSYQYDAYGNMTDRGTETVEYDVFNKPTNIAGTTFSYGPDHRRFKQVSGNRTTYYFNGGAYEEIIENGQTTQRSTVGGFLVRNTTGGTTTQTYLHRDHIGSVEAMTNELGQLIDRMSFDPWGQRQLADWETGDPTGGDPNTYPTTRGFTGHEMLEQTDLIHMNGRVYDPTIGRFLSPDLLIQAPFNTQSFNRYSYVFNNPLSFTDPSGYCTEAHPDCNELGGDPAEFEKMRESLEKAMEEVKTTGSQEEAQRIRREEFLNGIYIDQMQQGERDEQMHQLLQGVSSGDKKKETTDGFIVKEVLVRSEVNAKLKVLEKFSEDVNKIPIKISGRSNYTIDEYGTVDACCERTNVDKELIPTDVGIAISLETGAGVELEGSYIWTYEYGPGNSCQSACEITHSRTDANYTSGFVYDVLDAWGVDY